MLGSKQAGISGALGVNTPPCRPVEECFTPLALYKWVCVCACLQILSFWVSRATVYSTPTHSANTSYSPHHLHLPPPSAADLQHVFLPHISTTVFVPTTHSLSLPLYEWHKTTWLKGKILWLGAPGFQLNHTHKNTHTHTHTYMHLYTDTHTAAHHISANSTEYTQ